MTSGIIQIALTLLKGQWTILLALALKSLKKASGI